MESWKDTGKESWKKPGSQKAGKPGKSKGQRGQWISRLIGAKITNRIRVVVMKIS